MAYIPVPNTVKVAMNILTGGQLCAMTFTVEKGSQPSIADLEGLNEIFRSWFDNSVKPLMHATCQLTSIVSTDLTTASSPSVTLSVNPPISGTAGGNTSPNNVTLATSFRTSLRGRSYRGRSYIVGIPTSVIQSAVMVAGSYATNIILSFLALRAALVAGAWTHVVVSRVQNKVALAVGVTTPITSYLIDTFLDSMRRRLAGRGE